MESWGEVKSLPSLWEGVRKIGKGGGGGKGGGKELLVTLYGRNLDNLRL